MATKEVDYRSSELAWEQGEYLGQFHENLRDGLGTMRFQTQERSCSGTYKGEWKHGKPDGYGVETIQRKNPFGRGNLISTYEGEWKGGQRSGYGKEIGEAGPSEGLGGLELAFENGAPEWAGMDYVYSGEWIDGQRQGHGILRQALRFTKYESHPDRSVLRAGTFDDGKLEGYHTIGYEDVRGRPLEEKGNMCCEYNKGVINGRAISRGEKDTTQKTYIFENGILMDCTSNRGGKANQ
eukprot:gene12400-14650_t